MKIRTRLAAIGAASALFLVPAAVAHAATVYSGWSGYGPVNGISYENQSFTHDNTPMGGAVSVRSGSTIPAGWSGGQATLFRNGSACSSSSMYYYPSATTGWSGGGTSNYCGSGNYTTQGSTAAYNGGSYDYFYTATSPILAG